MQDSIMAVSDLIGSNGRYCEHKVEVGEEVKMG